MRSILSILFSVLLFSAPLFAQITPDSIHIPISNDPATGYPRQAYHQNFIIGPDLNMVQEIRIVTMHPSGVPMSVFVKSDTAMTPVQKTKAMQRFADQLVTKTTAGSYLNLTTGKLATKPARPAIMVVDSTQLDHPLVPIPDPNWKADPAIITEKTYFQGVSLGALKAKGVTITDKTTVAQLIYLLLSEQILTIDRRGDL